ncbi:MAG TPA: Crp/Fnr family transcriptional regulator [Aquaticitalea sp.]|nr:Crp/Fnr family transcriptional regulator [Aquaticitalea sp.]HNU58912.1 Crp/Fnr family transcriptional regulator [Aquaticitalea sp.]
MVPLNILEKYKPLLKSYPNEHVLFNEGESAKFYFQLFEGQLQMMNLSEDGKKMVQGYFGPGDSFGEPPLFGNFKYPASALTLSECKIFMLPKDVFFDLLKAHPEIHIKFTKEICKRMVYKAKIIKELSIYPPEHRILTLLNHLKSLSGTNGPYTIALTRQQISELTGLRVETVIRAIKKLEASEALAIRNRKIVV